MNDAVKAAIHAWKASSKQLEAAIEDDGSQSNLTLVLLLNHEVFRAQASVIHELLQEGSAAGNLEYIKYRKR